MKSTDNTTPRLVAVILAALVLVSAAFVAGRRTAAPGQLTVSALADESGHEDHSDAAGEHEGEEGVIVFSEEALDHANLVVEPVSYSSVATSLPVTGEVEPDLSGLVKITPRVSGRVTAVLANVGDTVGSGAVLARIASPELAGAQAAYRQASGRLDIARQNLARQRHLAKLGEFSAHEIEEARRETAEAHGELGTAKSEVVAARSGIAEARSEVRAMEAALEQAQTQAAVAKSRAARAQALFGEELVSRQDLEQAQADARDAEAGIFAARARLTREQAAVESAESRLGVAQAKLRAAEQRAKIADRAESREERVYRGGYATSKEIVEVEAAVRQASHDQRAAADQVRLLGGQPGGGETVSVTAPMGGRVTERTVTLGETVSPETALFTVVNLNSVWAQLRVYSRDLSTLRAGQKITITSEAAPGRTFMGRVSYIGDAVDEATRTVKVRAVVTGAGGILKPGAFVRGTIDTGARTQAIAVPKHAVQTLDGRTVVFVAGDHPGEFEPREVQTGETSGNNVVIREGLQSGDRVVRQGAFTVKAQAMKSELGEGHGH